MKEGLIALNYECSKCNERMGLYERKSAVLDGDFEWVCSTITSQNIYGRTPMILLTMRPSRLFVKIRCHAVASTRKRSAPLLRGILFGFRKGPLRGRYVTEELRASPVTALRNALPKAVPEVEDLGYGWLGGGHSFISRNLPLLQPWTVPSSTLWGFSRCLALKNPPVVTLGTLEKCGNSWPGGGRDETGRNP
ncbi:hypothetical protein TNCV_4985781 [Trichonephila clavipes]|nr:hypothetical protein TNCV_4985781 [Trichonephila clavipes]